MKTRQSAVRLSVSQFEQLERRLVSQLVSFLLLSYTVNNTTGNCLFTRFKENKHQAFATPTNYTVRLLLILSVTGFGTSPTDVEVRHGIFFFFTFPNQLQDFTLLCCSEGGK